VLFSTTAKVYFQQYLPLGDVACILHLIGKLLTGIRTTFSYCYG